MKHAFEAAGRDLGCVGRAGTARATIDHTYTDRIHEVRVNGTPMGEMGINAAVAGYFGVPVALVSGDETVAAEARDTFGEHVETVVVKRAVSRHAARCLSPAEARRRIRAVTKSRRMRSRFDAPPDQISESNGVRRARASIDRGIRAAGSR